METSGKMSKEVGEEYLSSLADLNVNSKPLINMLTILAEENIQHAPVIVQAIDRHLAKVNPDVKLPILYLIDSIVKNVGREYKQLFTQCIVNLFCGVFERVNERVREKLFLLRQTWVEVFPQAKLYAMDIKVNCIDPGWPIIAKLPPAKSPAIHVNPIFLKNKEQHQKVAAAGVDDVHDQLREKHRTLLELQKRKLELELLKTKKQIEEQEREINLQTASVAVGGSGSGPLPLMPEPQMNTLMASTNLGPSRSFINTNTNAIIPQANPLTVTTGIGPKVRVAPVNSALISSIRSRDPRLARQQQQQQQHQIPAPVALQNPPPAPLANLNPINNNEFIHALNKPIQMTSVSSSYSDISNVMIGKNINHVNKSLLPKIPKYSRQNNQDRPPNIPSNINPRQMGIIKKTVIPNATKLSPSKSLPGTLKNRNNRHPSSASSTKMSSSSSTKPPKSDRPPRNDDNKKRVRKRSPSPLSSRSSYNKSPKRNNDEPKAKRSSSSPVSNHSSAGSSSKFKELKKSTKDRNYIRKNRSHTKSPSPGTELKLASNDTKVDVSRISPQKADIAKVPENATITAEQSPQILELVAAKDVDLRVLQPNMTTPSNLSAISSNNESSPDSRKRQTDSEVLSEEPNNKKTKTEQLDELFGSEDVDLRQINNTPASVADIAGIRPITPPPPMISTEKIESSSWAKLKNDGSKKSPAEKSSLESARAKLFAEENKRSRSRDSTSSSSGDRRKAKLDLDLRKVRDAAVMDENSQEGTEVNIKIMMEQAQEQLNSKNIDVEQYGSMIKQIFEINESKKLREAQRIELISKKNNAWQQEDLTPISDNEMANFSNSDGDVDSKQTKKERLRFKKKRDMEESQHVAPSIISSYAQSTAAELRNSSTERKDRWSKSESTSRWGATWDKQHISNAMPIQQHTSSAWNIRSNLPNLTIPPPPNPPITGITPFINPIANPPPVLNHMWQGGNPFNQFDLKPPQNIPQPQPLINADVVRTINIDQISREIRFYDDIAIAFMNWDEPKEIGFQSGQRRVTVDDKDSIILGFNEPSKMFAVDGKDYQIRLGSPTRELYIDSKWYECFFGDPPIVIPLDNKMRVLKIDGPPPPVKIGNLRQDLVVGKINMIIDAKDMVPVFLDSKVQYFEINGQVSTIQFADYLLTVLINEEPIIIEFGGLPKSLFIRGKKHFVRFTALPNGITPGKVFIRNMVRTQLHRDVSSPPAPAIVSLNDVPQSDHVPSTVVQQSQTESAAVIEATSFPEAPARDVVPVGVAPNVEATAANLAPIVTSQPAAVNTILGNINIDDLFQKLLATGIINKPVTNTVASEKSPKDDKKLKEKEKIVFVNLLQPETIKARQSGIVFQLFSGMQCSSCGVRFPPEQTMKYSQHLDWHFRQNRRDRDSARRAHSRRWYYDVSDWIQYEEIEDLEEREKNWFETQQTEMEVGTEDSNHRADSPPPSCPAGSDDDQKSCNMCHDPFEQFYHEETEEWHLRSAIRVDDKTYHPLCYEDYKASLIVEENELQANDENANDSQDDSVKIKLEKRMPGDDTEDIKVDDDDDDDDVIEITTQEPVITEILDEDEETPMDEASIIEVINNDDATTPATVEIIDDSLLVTNAEETEESKTVDTSIGNETDVEILEPNIPITDLDDIEDTPHISIVDDSLSHGSPFALMKIKEEPKDDDEEEDAFEEVGTVCPPVDNLNNENDDEYVPEPITEATSHEPAATDSPIELVENIIPSSNRIKINITKAVKPQPIATIITSHPAGSGPPGSLSQGGGAIDEDFENSDNLENNKNSENVQEKEEEIEFEFKENLKNVIFEKVETNKCGYETSGLCSIM